MCGNARNVTKPGNVIALFQKPLTRVRSAAEPSHCVLNFHRKLVIFGIYVPLCQVLYYCNTGCVSYTYKFILGSA